MFGWTFHLVLLFVSNTMAGPSVLEYLSLVPGFTTLADDDLQVYEVGYKEELPQGDHTDEDDETKNLQERNTSLQENFHRLLYVLFDTQTYYVKQVRYTIHDPNHNESNDHGACENFPAGNDVIDTNIFTNVYSEENLKRVLNPVKTLNKSIVQPTLVQQSVLHIDLNTLHVRLCTSCFITATTTSQPCVYHDQELTPQLLAPRRHFNDEHSRNALCTWLNTAPIWDQAKAALQRLYAFVSKISTKIKNLNVISGTFGSFRYPKPDVINRDPARCETRQLGFLYEDKILAPQVIYNVIDHRIRTNEKTIDYGVILVTANGEWVKEQDSYCTTIPCTDINWHSVNRNSSDEKKWQTVCCALSNENLQKFEIKPDDSEKQPLDLAKVHFDSSSKTTNVLEGITLPDQ